MSDEDLEVLVTLDDSPYAPDEDTFDHQHNDQSRTLMDEPKAMLYISTS